MKGRFHSHTFLRGKKGEKRGEKGRRAPCSREQEKRKETGAPDLKGKRVDTTSGTFVKRGRRKEKKREEGKAI